MPDDTSTTGAPASGAPSTTADAGVDIKELTKRLEYLESENSKAYASRDKAKAEARELRAQHKAVADADQQALAQAGKWEELATKYKAKLDELAPLAEKYTAYQAEVAKRAEAKLADMPEDLRELVPDGLDPATTIAHVERVMAKFAATTTNASAPRVPPATPPAAGASIEALIGASSGDRAKALMELKRSDPAQFAELSRLASAALRGG